VGQQVMVPARVVFLAPVGTHQEIKASVKK
jgi:hypothetical protein